MRRFGLIGYPLTHSFSADYFQAKFRELEITDCQYELFELNEIDYVKLLFQSYTDLEGLNVTIPYKESIIPYLDDLDEAAGAIGAVNCIQIKNGIKTGFNTDYLGFTGSLKHIDFSNKTALVFGNGGASKAVQFGLNLMGFRTTVVSRQPSKEQLGYAELTGAIIAETGLLINTTPLGMYPEVEAKPGIPYTHIHAGQWAYDLIYNPTITKFLEAAAAQGAQTINGAAMLKIQAEESWNIWNA